MSWSIATGCCNTCLYTVFVQWQCNLVYSLYSTLCLHRELESQKENVNHGNEMKESEIIPAKYYAKYCGSWLLKYCLSCCFGLRTTMRAGHGNWGTPTDDIASR